MRANPIERNTMTATIQQQSQEVATAAAGGLPPEVAAVFAAEQQRFREQGAPEHRVRPGDTIDDFTLSDATGAPVSLGELLSDGPAVLVFYRGGWCPYCNIALRTYQGELLPELERYGARLVAISPQRPDQSLSTAEKAELSFTVLSDPAAEVARRLGIVFTPSEDALAAQRKLGLDLAAVNETVDLPMPTVLIVDQDGIVRFADTHADYTGRTEVSEIIDALDALAGEPS
jgi:peroxiredoxin